MAVLDRWVDTEIRDAFARMEVPLNRYGYDAWGASRDTAMQLMVVARWLYRKYFRVTTEGLDNVPSGRVLLIANHGGQVPMDGMLIAAAMALDAKQPRFVRAMIEKFFAAQPILGVFMTRLGQVIGLPDHAEKLLNDNHAVLVFPEGERGGGRTIRDRYRLVGFGQGFLRLALKTNTPIVPVGVVGCEESCLSFSRMTPLAKLMGAPYLPLTPTILPVPLPTKVSLHFGEPLRFDGTGNEENATIAEMVRTVEGEVQNLMDKGLAARRSIFFG